jgi:hypothetical protein
MKVDPFSPWTEQVFPPEFQAGSLRLHLGKADWALKDHFYWLTQHVRRGFKVLLPASSYSSPQFPKAQHRGEPFHRHCT